VAETIVIAAAMGMELRGLEHRLGRMRKIQNPSLDAREGRHMGKTVISIRTGVGRHKAAERLRLAIDSFSPNWILVIGIAGALGREFRVGDPFMVSSACLWPGDAETLPLEQAHELVDVFSDQETPLVRRMRKGRRVRRGRLLTVNSFVNSVQEKRKLRAAGFDLVDMEFAAMAAVASEAGVPIKGLKVVSDTAAHDFPGFHYSPDGGTRAPLRLAANCVRACRTLGLFAHSWLRAAAGNRK